MFGARVILVESGPLVVPCTDGRWKATAATLLPISRGSPFHAELEVLEPHRGITGSSDHPRVFASTTPPISVIQITGCGLTNLAVARIVILYKEIFRSQQIIMTLTLKAIWNLDKSLAHTLI